MLAEARAFAAGLASGPTSETLAVCPKVGRPAATVPLTNADCTLADMDMSKSVEFSYFVEDDDRLRTRCARARQSRGRLL